MAVGALPPEDLAKIMKNSYKECVNNARRASQMNGSYPRKFSLGTVEENAQESCELIGAPPTTGSIKEAE